MNLLLALAKKVALLTLAGVLQKNVIRWLKGEVSLQEEYDRLLRRRSERPSSSAPGGDGDIQASD